MRAQGTVYSPASVSFGLLCAHVSSFLA